MIRQRPEQKRRRDISPEMQTLQLKRDQWQPWGGKLEE